MNARPSWVFLCVKNDNMICQFDKLSQSFSDIFHNYFTWQKMSKSIIKIALDINEYLRNGFTIQTIQYLNNCLDIKGLRFVTKAISPWYCCFYTQKHPRGASIHEINESFPLKPSLIWQPRTVYGNIYENKNMLWYSIDINSKSIISRNVFW